MSDSAILKHRPDFTAKSEPHISFQIQYITRKWTLTLLAGFIATFARRQKPPSIRWPTAAQCFVAPSDVWRSSPPGTAGTARGPANGSSTWRLLQRRSGLSSSQSALRSAGKHSEWGSSNSSNSPHVWFPTKSASLNGVNGPYFPRISPLKLLWAAFNFEFFPI